MRTKVLLFFDICKIILVNLLQYTTILGVTNPIFDNFWSNFEQFLLYVCSPFFCGQFFSGYWFWMLIIQFFSFFP